jgi:hypothetical protein
VDKIHHVVLADRRKKVHEIAEAVTISYERDFHILHNKFDLKSFLQTFSSLQSREQKRIQSLTPGECLEVFQRNPTDFKRRFVTMDET